MINIAKEIFKGSGMWLIMFIATIPIAFMMMSVPSLVVEGVDRDALPEEAQESFDTTLAWATAIPLFLIGIMFVHFIIRTNAGQIIKTANVEKRMEKLKKLGTKKFIQQTEAVLVDSSPRGNKLYKSDKIIKGRTLKFLIYKDKSTDREYISFVKDEFINADEAMASKFSLGKQEYSMLKLENEA